MKQIAYSYSFHKGSIRPVYFGILYYETSTKPFFKKQGFKNVPTTAVSLADTIDDDEYLYSKAQA